MILKSPIGSELNGSRLDEAVSKLFAGVSKSEARRIIDRGGCTINAVMVRVASRPVKAGDVIYIGVMEPGRYHDLELPPEALLYEDDDLVALNKPEGVNSQRTPYQLKGTLEYWVSEYFRTRGINEPCRVVHRLDRGTTGAMVFPKHKKAAAWLSGCFKDGMVEKCYLAQVCGVPQQEHWTVDAPVGPLGKGRQGVVDSGRPAVTHFRMRACGHRYSLVEAQPQTGRTHQIRVHLAHCGLPIVGDTLYGGEPAGRMMLHCLSMVFRGWPGGVLKIEAPCDERFSAAGRGMADTPAPLLSV